MVYAVQGWFGFQNAARRDAVMQNVQTRLSTEVTWGETVTQALAPTPRQPDPSMLVEVRFATDAARDAFWTDVIAFMGTGVNGPVTGSYIQQHDCPHDEPDAPPCVVSERIDYA
jgi:hypothetical protein